MISRRGTKRSSELFVSVNTPHSAVRADIPGAAVSGPVRPSTETKPAFRTTEFVAYVVTVVAVLIASALVGDSDGRGDVFLADKAWFYVTLLAVGYMVSRGLAKAGVRGRRDA